MIDSREREDQSENDVFFDHADAQEAAALESQSGKSTARSIWGVAGRVVRRKRFLLALALGGLVVVLYVLRKAGYISPESLILVFKSHPVLAPILFTVIYAFMVVCLVPTLPMNLGAGLIWGAYSGGFLTVLGAGMGSTIAFLAARYIASDYLNDKFRHSAWVWLKNEIQRQGWKAVAFTRINPIFPFGPSSYFFGLTNITFMHYIVTTALSIIPLSILFAAMGSSIGSLVQEGDIYRLVKEIMTVALAITLLLLLRLAIKRLSGRKRNPSD